MAIYLPHADALILEIPKTGTTWMRKALDVLQIEHHAAPVQGAACPRHATPTYYRPASLTFAVVRHPQSYLESFWRFHHIRPRTYDPSRYYPHQKLGPCPGNFATYARWIVATRPGVVSQLFTEYAGPEASPIAQMVGRQEHLEQSLSGFLQACGYDVAAEDLHRIALQNVSRPAACDWPPEVLRQYLAAEAPAIDRWYPA